jgi:hypothetical protein
MVSRNLLWILLNFSGWLHLNIGRASHICTHTIDLKSASGLLVALSKDKVGTETFFGLKGIAARGISVSNGARNYRKIAPAASGN